MYKKQQLQTLHQKSAAALHKQLQTLYIANHKQYLVLSVLKHKQDNKKRNCKLYLTQRRKIAQIKTIIRAKQQHE